MATARDERGVGFLWVPSLEAEILHLLSVSGTEAELGPGRRGWLAARVSSLGIGSAGPGPAPPALALLETNKRCWAG
ncbi:hypothetical protein CPLU01_04324 [Colletotrichum plurivorum]|uniref:Uncharacterized protein n=1 Tax=Colletotrichum plurivorum TaxID=2175906 RepID=A0A8H6KQF1_9PEZI|nr:hypothetical protein CPLU01_04324 [Colletotrichum plurivorum]